MNEARERLYDILIATAFLLLMSIYRQYSLINYGSLDSLRPFIMYATYVLLMVWWASGIIDKVTSDILKQCLLVIDLMMFVWVTVRLLQDTVLVGNVAALRWTGYIILYEALFIPHAGLYAALALGRNSMKKYNRRMRWTNLVTGIFTILALTDRFHHFIFYIDPSEPQPNTIYHPNIGFYLLIAWALLLVIGRVGIIFMRNSSYGGDSLRMRLFPFTEVVLLLIFAVPYILSNFVVKYEIIEFTVGVFFIDAIFWELCSITGLVPTNTNYEEVFKNSSLSMQILDKSGKVVVASDNSRPIGRITFEELAKEGTILRDMNTELHIHEFDNNYLVWEKDIRDLNDIIADLKATNTLLESESDLLNEELRVSGEKDNIATKNEIYDTLSTEIEPSLYLLKTLISYRKTETDKKVLYKKIIIIGLYIKRRLNLRLIHLETGKLSAEDVRISIEDMMNNARKCGIPASLSFSVAGEHDPNYYIYAFDVIENIMENEHFDIEEMTVLFLDDASCEIRIKKEIPRHKWLGLTEEYATSIEDEKNGYAVYLREEVMV
ncbi:MAG: hypothetical protein K6F92_00690 [Lachnospiraceae bacterium]|nr:hypothetical protein [Lachnospiraceae bacterium]